jgi:hypothetical protein
MVIAGVLVCAIVLAAGVTLAPAKKGKGHDGDRGSNGDRSERVLLGVLNGRNEVDAEGDKGAGDPDGRGSASGVIDDGQLCFGLTVKNLAAPTAAHIHRGRKKENGPIVVTLAPPQGGDPGASSGCVPVAAGLAEELLRHPKRFYWNVHTQEFPGGAVRGQVRTKKN